MIKFLTSSFFSIIYSSVPRSDGLNASRSPFPNRLKLSIKSEMKRAGNTIIYGYVLKYGCALESIFPTLVILPVLRVMIPRYDRLDSVMIIPGMVKTELVMIVPNELGKMCLNISLPSLAPNVLAASTYS